MKNPGGESAHTRAVQIGPTLGMPGVPLKAFPQNSVSLSFLIWGGIDYIPGRDMQAALVGLERDSWMPARPRGRKRLPTVKPTPPGIISTCGALRRQIPIAVLVITDEELHQGTQ